MSAVLVLVPPTVDQAAGLVRHVVVAEAERLARRRPAVVTAAPPRPSPHDRGWLTVALEAVDLGAVEVAVVCGPAEGVERGRLDAARGRLAAAGVAVVVLAGALDGSPLDAIAQAGPALAASLAPGAVSGAWQSLALSGRRPEMPFVLAAAGTAAAGSGVGGAPAAAPGATVALAGGETLEAVAALLAHAQAVSGGWLEALWATAAPGLRRLVAGGEPDPAAGAALTAALAPLARLSAAVPLPMSGDPLSGAAAPGEADAAAAHTALLVEMRALRLRIAELEGEVARLPHLDARITELTEALRAARAAALPLPAALRRLARPLLAARRRRADRP